MPETQRKRGRPVGSTNKVTTPPDTNLPLSVRQDGLPSSYRQDGWNNSLAGLGQKQDKSLYTMYGKASIIDDASLLQMYLGDGLSSRIIDIVADDMTREWIWIDEESQRKVILKSLISLDAEEAFNTSLKWQRLYGGAIMIIGALDGRNIDMPLYEKGIRGIEYLKVIDRTCVNIQSSIFDKNPLSPRYGKIEKYNVRYYINNEVLDLFIHYTRVLEFHNDPVPVGKYNGMNPDTRYWGISSLQKINEAISNLGGITQSTVNILFDFVTGTYKFAGLSHLLAADSNGDAQRGLVTRMNAINASKSIINAIILDKEEDYTKQFTSLAGLPEVIDRFMLQLSGSTGIPVTRLYGRSPAGLNATGENDTRNYYDLIEATQRNRLMPPLNRLINLICAWKKIDPDSFELSFNALYQLSEEEKADIAKTEAETEEIKARTALMWVDAGMRDPVEVAKEFGFEDEIDLEKIADLEASETTPPPKMGVTEESDDPTEPV